MDPRIQELIDNLDGLTEDELRELATLIVKRADEVESAEDENNLTAAGVAELGRLAEAARKVTALRAGRDLGELREAVTASGASSGGSGVKAVAAARRGQRPTAGAEAGRTDTRTGTRVLLATGAASHAEEPVTDRHALAEAMAEHLGRMSRTGPPRGVALVASAFTDYPEERRLGDDPMVNTRILEDAVGLSALLATGGVCLPVNVDYTQTVWSTPRRPLKEGLPAFQASRGGLRFVTPPDIGPLGAATGIWTAATDAEPLASTKPLFSVACGTEELVYVAAVSTRIGFGNMQSRFQPELVAANTELALAAAARKAELNLLELIQAACVKDVTSAKVLGATRDIITAIRQASANFRFTHRLPREVKLTGVFPAWLLDLVAIDLAREVAHDNSGERDVLAITDEQVTAMFEAHGINPIWTLDGLPESEGKYPAQTFAAQTAEGAIKTFPTKLVWNLFPEGAMQFLDGGRLDLGVVRDSTLDATNDYETFIETFEAVADRGFSKAATQFVTELCANGESAATVSTAGACA
jgi:hypothetical protein